MALTIAINKRDKTIGKKVVYATITLDSSYATGGESITPGSLGLTSIDFILFDGGLGYRPQFDYANSKIMMYTSAGTQTTNATDLSSIVLKALVFGT
jgi:hypothetical protein